MRLLHRCPLACSDVHAWWGGGAQCCRAQAGGARGCWVQPLAYQCAPSVLECAGLACARLLTAHKQGRVEGTWRGGQGLRGEGGVSLCLLEPGAPPAQMQPQPVSHSRSLLPPSSSCMRIVTRQPPPSTLPSPQLGPSGRLGEGWRSKGSRRAAEQQRGHGVGRVTEPPPLRAQFLQPPSQAPETAAAAAATEWACASASGEVLLLCARHSRSLPAGGGAAAAA